MTPNPPSFLLHLPPAPALPAAGPGLRHGLGAVLRARWRWLVTAPLLATLGTWSATAWHPPVYTAQAQLVLGLETAGLGVGAATPRARVAAASDRLLATQISVLRSPRVGRAAALALASHPDAEVRAFAQAEQAAAGGVDAWALQVWPRRLTLTRTPPSRMLALSAQAPHPHYAAALANEAARSLLHTLWQLQSSPAREFATALQAKAEASALSLTQARQAWARIDPTAAPQTHGAAPSAWAAAEALSPRALALSAELAGLNAPDRTDAEAARQLQREASALASLGTRWGEAHPGHQAAAARRDLAAAALQQQAAASHDARAIDAAVLAATQQHQAQAWRRHQAHKAAARHPLWHAHPLQRDAAQAETTYRQLQQQAQHAELAALAPLRSAQWLAAAEAPEASASGLPAILLSLFGGSLAGLCGVLLLESRSRRVRTRRDLRQSLGLPLLGVLDAPQGPYRARPARSLAAAIGWMRAAPAVGAISAAATCFALRTSWRAFP